MQFERRLHPVVKADISSILPNGQNTHRRDVPHETDFTKPLNNSIVMQHDQCLMLSNCRIISYRANGEIEPVHPEGFEPRDRLNPCSRSLRTSNSDKG